MPYRVSADAASKITGTNWSEIKESYADSVLEWIDDAFLPGLGRNAAEAICADLKLTFPGKTFVTA